MTQQGHDGLRIMAIDDDATMRSILKYQLDQMGIEDVIEATNGKHALQKLGELRPDAPDLILCDLHMDEMDGLQFCNAFRTDKALKANAVPIIIVTADGDKLAHEVAQQVGAEAVLAKPFTVEQLRDQIEQTVGYEIALLAG